MGGMVLGMKFANIFKNRQKQTVRETRIEAIEEMGFKLLDERGWHNGRFYPKRYLLVASDGRRLDNGGEGFGSSNEAHQAAQAEVQRNKVIAEPGITAAKASS